MRKTDLLQAFWR